MKTLPRLSSALALTFALSLPSHALFGWGDKPDTGPLGAVLGEVAGPVQVKRAAGGDFAPAAAQTALDSGDVLKTGPGGRAVVVFLDGSKMQVKESATFAVESHSAKKVAVKIDVGTLQFWIKKVAQRRAYQMRTPTAVASVRGTEGEIDVAPNGATEFVLFSGSLGITDAHGVEVRLEPNQQVKSEPEKGLSEAKVEAVPATKTMDPAPVTPTETKAEPTAPADATTTTDTTATDTTGTGTTGTGTTGTTTSNPAQNQAVSNSTP